MAQPKSIPIACTLSADSLQTRKENELLQLFQKALQIESVENGYSFQFPGDKVMAQQLFAFIQVERECCAFFQFNMEFEPQNGPIWLTLTGAEGVKAFIESQGILEFANLGNT